MHNAGQNFLMRWSSSRNNLLFEAVFVHLFANIKCDKRSFHFCAAAGHEPKREGRTVPENVGLFVFPS